MGLDAWACEVDEKDFKNDVGPLPEEVRHPDFAYWRKHHELEKWMSNLYYEKGGKDWFNLKYVKLSKKDIQQLYKALLRHDLIDDPGKKYEPYYIMGLAEDLKFIAKALSILNDPDKKDHCIIYYSWW